MDDARFGSVSQSFFMNNGFERHIPLLPGDASREKAFRCY
jgi:hypothetical protein